MMVPGRVVPVRRAPFGHVVVAALLSSLAPLNPQPMTAQDLRLPSGLSYRILRDALRELRPAVTFVRPVASDAPEAIPRVQIDGLLVDETITPTGRDFYDIFYAAWQPPEEASGYTLRFQEQPSPGVGTRLVLLLDGDPLFQLRLQPRYEMVEALAQQAVVAVREEVARRHPSEFGGAAGQSEPGRAPAALGRTRTGIARTSAAEAEAEAADTVDALDRQARELAAALTGATVTRVRDRILVSFKPDLLFGVEEAELRRESLGQLQGLALSLETYARMHVLILGHTDATGPAAYNMDLSERRAREAARVLMENGVTAERIETRGMGESSPVASNETEEGRRLNRRVEVWIYLPDARRVAGSDDERGGEQ